MTKKKELIKKELYFKKILFLNLTYFILGLIIYGIGLILKDTNIVSWATGVTLIALGNLLINYVYKDIIE